MKFFLSFILIVLVSFTHLAEGLNVSDPYIWLEQESPQTLKWLETQHTLSEAYFQGDSSRKAIRKQLTEILNFDTWGIPYKQGKNYYFTGMRKEQQQASLYRMNESKEISLVIDPTTFCQAGTTSLTGYTIDGHESFVAYGLSIAGSDWQQWRIKNIKTGEDLPDILTKIKFSHPIWDQTGEGLYYFRFDENDSEDALSTSQSLYYHRLGTSTEEDRKLFQAAEPGELCFSLSLTKNGRYLLFKTKTGSSHSNGIVYTDLKEGFFTFVQLFPNQQANYDYFGSVSGRFFFVTNDSAPKGRLISIDPLQPEREHWVEHVSESDLFMEQACFAGNKFVISYFKDAYSQLKIFDQQGHFCQDILLPGVGTAGSNWKGWRLSGSQKSSEFFYPYSSFTQPLTIYHGDAETGVSEIFTAPDLSWQLQDYEVKQVFYPSKDETLVPMFIVHKQGLQLDGNHPTLLYGYGGFHIPITPSFDPKHMAWLEAGGIYVLANIRGGGEYGEEWHHAGSLHAKQNSFDDFIAAGEWLCDNGYTNPAKLAISGRSNGGLLVGACLTQRPDLFKAAIAGVGVLDMLRFHHFTIGWAWISEYGNPDDPEDFKVLHAYSPYHQVKSGIAYPSTLIVTSDHDNRVVPLHSYKFAAVLQEAQSGGNPVLLRVYKETGHGAGRSREQIIEEDVDYLMFLFRELQVK